ncbi:hypothetical protein M9458_036922, partial [Cirrhinus mrigala]
MSPRDGSPVKTSSPRRVSAQDLVSPLCLAKGELAPRLSLASPKVFFFSIYHRWSFGSLPLS